MPGNTVTIAADDGNLINIDESRLRKGDIVVFQTGDLVPADLKLIEARSLEVDEFELTGELMPAAKVPGDEDIFIYKGSKVLKGSGKGIVIATGEQTEYGKVLHQAWEREQAYDLPIFKARYLYLIGLLLPPYILHVTQSKQPAVVTAYYILLAAAFVLLQNDAMIKSKLVANEKRKLERQNIHIRNANALERMHQVDTLCLDKTGVLTTRHVEVKKFYLGSSQFTDQSPTAGNAFDWVRLACAFCHDVAYFERRGAADPADEALISYALKNGIDVQQKLQQAKRIYDLPFDSENRYMACGFNVDGEAIYFAKGDPAVLQKMCNRYLTFDGVEKKPDREYWQQNHANIDAITRNGDTVLGLAFSNGSFDAAPSKYTFLCLLHLENALQPGIQETVDWIHTQGLRSLMLTGDRSETAIRIAKDCGIVVDSTACLSGGVMNRMALNDVAQQSDYCSIYARLVPSQKGILIRLLQQRGHQVAMIGDGPNDGIALKVADIGISFVENSSPIARRLAKILINDVTELKVLIESAQRTKHRAGYLKILRSMVLAAVLLSLYGWILVQMN